jgi:hypothetical protein
MAELGPFDFLNSINSNKKNLIETAQDEKLYNPWMVNKGLSYFPDTIEYANMMNRLYHLDNKLQYEFLRSIIRPRKRFSKWAKKKNSGDLDLISEYFQCNMKRAEEYSLLLSPEDLNSIKKKLEQGGATKA